MVEPDNLIDQAVKNIKETAQALNLSPEFTRVSVNRNDKGELTWDYSRCGDNKEIIVALWGADAGRMYPNLAQHGFCVAYENDKGIIYAAQTEDPRVLYHCESVYKDLCVKGFFGPVVIDLKKML